MTDALDSDQLEIVEGGIESLSARDDGLDVNLRDPRGEGRVVGADLIINCTGPQARLSQTESPLLNNLLHSGLIKCDEMDMGIAVSDDFRATDLTAIHRPQFTPSALSSKAPSGKPPPSPSSAAKPWPSPNRSCNSSKKRRKNSLSNTASNAIGRLVSKILRLPHDRRRHPSC